MKRRRALITASILLIGVSMVGAETNEPGPFEKFFRSMRRAFSEPQQTSHPKSHTSKHESKSASNSQGQTPASTPTTSSAENSGMSAPPNERNTRTATKASSKKGDDFRYGIPVPGKKGFVTSPYSPDSGYIDVRGFQPGTPVKDPYSGKIILTP
jgi:hypothetical protein